MALGFSRGGYNPGGRIRESKRNLKTFLLEEEQAKNLESINASKAAAKVKAVTTGKDLYSKYLHNKSAAVMKQDKIKDATSLVQGDKVNTYGKYGDNPVAELLGIESVGVNPKLYQDVGHEFATKYNIKDFSDTQKLIAGRKLAAGQQVKVPGSDVVASSNMIDTSIVNEAESVLEGAGGLSGAGGFISKYALPGISVGTSLYGALNAEDDEQAIQSAAGIVGGVSAIAGTAASAGAFGAGEAAAAVAAWGGPIGWLIAGGSMLYSLADYRV